MWRGELSLRRLSVLIQHLPRDAATSAALHGEVSKWTPEAVLLADLFHAWTGQPHPSLPKATTEDKSRARNVRERLLAQRRRLEGTRT